MAFVSKQPLPKEVERQLHEQFVDVLVAHDDVRAVRKLTYELFTPTERLMLAKRIAIVLLLEKGYSTYAVAQLLCVSDTTAARLDQHRENGRFAAIIKTLKAREHRHSILGMIETLVTFGMPGVASRSVRDRLRKDIEHWRAGGD